MIAFAIPTRSASAALGTPKRTTTAANLRPAWHSRFLELLPDILRHSRKYLRGLSSHAREEALDEIVVRAFVAYARLVELDKEELAYASPLGRYAAVQYHAGRRLGVRANCHDITSRYCQRQKRLQVERLDRFDRNSGSWKEAVVEDGRFGPADAAAMRIDFRAWLKSLTKRNRHLAVKLASSASTSEVARVFGITSGRVSQVRRELRHSWRLFQGELGPVTA